MKLLTILFVNRELFMPQMKCYKNIPSYMSGHKVSFFNAMFTIISVDGKINDKQNLC